MTHDSFWIERTLRGDADLAELQQLDPEIASNQLREQGTNGLVLSALPRHGTLDVLVAHLRNQQRAAAVWELRHQNVMTRAIAALVAENCEPIVMKGTALAYWLYRDPSLRPRADTDVLVREDSRGQAEAALQESGFVRRFGIEGTVVTHQATYSLTAADGTVHALDLHWRANNSPVLAPLFPFSELSRFSEPLAPLGPAARRTDATRSLLLACVHRAVHEANPYYVDGRIVSGLSRLVWLYDVLLLCQAMSSQEWAELPAICRAKGLTRVVSDTLDDAALRLGASVPCHVQQALQSSGNHETAHRYVHGNKWRQRRMDWNALGWADRFRLIREVALPPASYMRARYANDKTWLYFLYVQRVARGWRAASPNTHTQTK